jgi:hypothetical protein
MARNLSVPPPRRPPRTATDDARRLVAPGAGAGPVRPSEPADLEHGADDELARVLGWLQRCTGDGALADELAVEVFRRRTLPGPACVEHAPADVRLRYLVVDTVLRARGTL